MSTKVFHRGSGALCHKLNRPCDTHSTPRVLARVLQGTLWQELKRQCDTHLVSSWNSCRSIARAVKRDRMRYLYAWLSQPLPQPLETLPTDEQSVRRPPELSRPSSELASLALQHGPLVGARAIRCACAALSTGQVSLGLGMGRTRGAHPSQPERAVKLLVVLRREIDEQVHVLAAECESETPTNSTALHRAHSAGTNRPKGAGSSARLTCRCTRRAMQRELVAKRGVEECGHPL